MAADPDLTWTELGCRVGGRHRSTVQREVDRNGGRSAYRAGAAQARAVRLRPCRIAKLISDPALAADVRARLKAGFSPAAIAHLSHGASTETIYLGVYSGVLGVKACDVLRSRRHRRRRRNAADHRAPSHFLGAFTSIHDRPRGRGGWPGHHGRSPRTGCWNSPSPRRAGASLRSGVADDTLAFTSNNNPL